MLTFSWLFVTFFAGGSYQLKPNGVHVCSRSVSYNVYISVTTTGIGYDNYRTCCSRILGACTRRCTRYRTRILYSTKKSLQIRHKPVYFCCSGWSKEGEECPIPICNPGCVHGKCVLPNTCKCNSEYQGPRCNVVKQLLVCKQDHMTLLLNKDIYPRDEKQVIRMVNDQTCKGDTNKTFISIATKYDRCGTTTTEDRESITYTNAALITLGNEDGSLVSRKRNITFDLVCKQKRLVDASSASFKPVNATVTTSEDGFGTFTISMTVLKSASYNNGYLSDDYPITVKFSDRVYMAMKLDSDNKNLRLLLQNCHATPAPDPSTKPRFKIVTERCPTDDTFQLHDQQDSQLQFSIVAFQFLKKTDGIYIHCGASICKGLSNDPQCAFGCQKHRKRRDVSKQKIFKHYNVSSGYIKILKDTKKETLPFWKSTTGYVVIGAGMIVTFLSLLGLTIKVTKSRQNHA